METANLPPLGGLGLKNTSQLEKRKTYGAAATTTYTVGVGGQGLFATKVKKEEVEADPLSLSSIDRDFEQFSTLNIELSADHVPLGEILERLQFDDGDNRNNFIRLHAVTDNAASTISATLNVATLDLSSGGSLAHHFGELNDVVFSISKAADPDPSTSPTSSSSMLSSPSFSPSIVPESSTTFLNNNNHFSSGERTGCKNTVLSSPSSVSSPQNTNTTHGVDPSKASPQECNLCNKMFGNASALAKHRLTHSDERKYLCTVCQKAFKRQDHLNGHLLTHRNKKPFECTTEGCNKSYCDARSLRRHRENHHSNREDKLVSPASSVTSNGDFDEKSLESDSFDSPKMPAITKVFSCFDSNPVLPTADIPAFSILENYINSDKVTVGKSSVASAEVLPSGQLGAREVEPTPPAAINMVECTICSRRFKNIPALNGHMRLHGGYYRKDVDKKNEPRSSVPNLSSSDTISTQTVSNNVRSLIEEKIIQKRKLEPNQSKNQSLIAPGVKFSSLCVPSMSCSNLTQCSTTVTYINEPPNKICRTTSVDSKSSLDNLVFPVLPQPDTSKLLANLQLRQQQQTQLHNPSQQQQQPRLPAPPQLPNVPLPNSKCYSSTATATTTNISSPVISKSLVTDQLSSSSSFTSPVSSSSFLSVSLSTSSSTVKFAHGYHNLLKVDVTKQNEPRIGAEFQAAIPPLLPPVPSSRGCLRSMLNPGSGECGDTLVWSPRWAEDLSPSQMETYLRVCSSGAAGVGISEEEALRILGACHSDVFQATREVLRPSLKAEHSCGPSSGVSRSAAATWSPEEVDLFYEALCRNRKDFRRIAADIPGKSSQECVEFYYVWKNLCREESQSLKGIINISQEELDSGLTI